MSRFRAPPMPTRRYVEKDGSAVVYATRANYVKKDFATLFPQFESIQFHSNSLLQICLIKQMTK